MKFQTHWLIVILCLMASACSGGTASNCNSEPCPTWTPVPTRTPRPTAPPSVRGGQVRQLTLSPQNETLLGVFTSATRSVVVYRTASNQTVIDSPGNNTRYTIEGSGERTVIAFGPSQVALMMLTTGQLTLRRGNAVSDLVNATPEPIPFNGGDDLALSYDSEGSLYLASNGQINRLNPDGNQWEQQGTYDGLAKQFALTRSGSLLLLTSDNVLRRDGNFWTVCFDFADIQQVLDPDTREEPASIAVFEDRVALAWAVAAGVDGQGDEVASYWLISVSEDSGATWSDPEEAASGANGTYGLVFSSFRVDGSLAVIGMFDDNDINVRVLFYPIVAQKIGNDWIPSLGTTKVEPLIPNVPIRPTGQVFTSSLNGLTVMAWEVVQLNGSNDVSVVTR